MLPRTLLCLISAVLARAQAQTTLSLNSVTAFNASSPASNAPFALPSSPKLTVSVAVCSGSGARFFVTNSSAAGVPGSGGGTDVFEIALADGHGNWTGVFTDGGTMAVEGAGQASFEVGVSDQGPLHEVLPDLPLLGDTTSNQALIFSPPFSPPIKLPPMFPNYTLPPANLSVPVPPVTSSNWTLVISPTPTSPLTGLPQTGCALTARASTGQVINETLWLKDEEGWRMQWIVGGLSPLTNYTAYVVQDKTKVSGPIYFATKSASFACPLVASLPYCPGVSYAVPLAPPAFPASFYDAQNLPAAIAAPLLGSLTNFTTSLLTFACGRDLYSPLVSCADCQRAYRRWLCAATFARCGEASPAAPDAFTAVPAPPGATGRSARPAAPGQQVFSALAPKPSGGAVRGTGLPPLAAAYAVLLPCLETCTAVDRACPAFLGFTCPTLRFNAAASYGVGYIDSGEDGGGRGQGATGAAQDRWGNLWCNAG